MTINWWLFCPGSLLLCFGILAWMLNNAPKGHEDEDGFHYD
jgi:hypothetical protein